MLWNSAQITFTSLSGIVKKYSVFQIAQYFKGASSREHCQRYWEHIRIGEYGDSFWGDVYFL